MAEPTIGIGILIILASIGGIVVLKMLWHLITGTVRVLIILAIIILAIFGVRYLLHI